MILKRSLPTSPILAVMAGLLPFSMMTLSDARAETLVAPDLVVTANRFETDRDKVGSSVTVITGEEIEKRGVTQIFDVLKMAPGLSISRSGGAGSTSQVRIRGSRTGQVKVLIDGVEVNDPSGDANAYDFNGLLTSDVARIEILRGPQSALYGNDAVAGVINIITKKGHGPLSGSATIEAGAYGTHQENARISAGGDWGDLSLSLTNFHTDGFSRLSGGDEADGTDTQNGTVNAGLNLAASTELRLTGGWEFTESEFDPFGQPNGPASQETANYHGAFDLIDRSLADGLETVLSVYGSRTDRDFDEPAGFVPGFTTFDGKRYGVEARATYQAADWMVLSGGASLEQERSKSASTPLAGIYTVTANVKTRTNGIFGQAQITPIQPLTLTLGARRDDNEQFGAETTFRVAAAYSIEVTDTILRGSYGTASQAPTLFQLYDPTYGNSALRVENSDGADFGMEQKLLDGDLSLDLTFFQTDYEDLIDFDFGTMKYLNRGKVRARGAEAGITYRIVPELGVSASYTYTQSRNRETDQQLPRVPLHEAAGAIDWSPTSDWSIYTAARFVGAQKDSSFSSETIPTHLVVDISSRYRLTDDVELFGRIENLLNRQYVEVAGFNTSDRAAYAGLRVGF